MKKNNFLCVDIGGTRIKAGLIPGFNTLDELKSIPIYSFRTLGWLNRTLPELISEDNWASIIKRFSLATDSFEKICIDLPGPIKNGIFERDDLIKENGVPKDLLKAFTKYACSKEIYLLKDADAWIIGAESFLKYQAPLEYPVIGLFLGTGVGISILRNYSEVISIEASREYLNYKALQEASGKKIENPWDVHSIIGDNFFSWIKSQPALSYPEIRDQFTKRVIAFYNSFSAYIEQKINKKIRTIVLGGGNSEFISIRQMEKAIGSRVINLEKGNHLPTLDLIPLIGLREYVEKEIKIISQS